jgi:hypothetical protein
MRFIDHETRNRDVLECANEIVGRESFRRHVEQLALARSRLLERVAAGVARQGRMQRRSADPAAIQLIDLVLHQRDERRDDERRAREQERRELESQRLAGPGRHHGQEILSRQDRLDELLLSVAKGSVTEVAL